MDEKFLTKAIAQLVKYDAKNEEAKKLGLKFADEVLTRVSTMEKAIVCGTFLDAVAQQEPDHECIELLLDWTFSTFWALEVERHLPLFDEYWTWLNDHNARKDNVLTWGDVDCSAWIEFPKDSHRKVIIIETHCAARDDNIHVFIRDHNDFSDSLDVRTCWPKTLRFSGRAKSTGWDWLEKASLTLYRQMDFEVLYHDFRDIDYCLSYDRILGRPGKVEHGHSRMLNIYWALWTLRGLGTGIEFPLYPPKQEEDRREHDTFH